MFPQATNNAMVMPRWISTLMYFFLRCNVPESCFHAFAPTQIQRCTIHVMKLIIVASKVNKYIIICITSFMIFFILTHFMMIFLHSLTRHRKAVTFKPGNEKAQHVGIVGFLTTGIVIGCIYSIIKNGKVFKKKKKNTARIGQCSSGCYAGSSSI